MRAACLVLLAAWTLSGLAAPVTLAQEPAPQDAGSGLKYVQPAAGSTAGAPAAIAAAAAGSVSGSGVAVTGSAGAANAPNAPNAGSANPFPPSAPALQPPIPAPPAANPQAPPAARSQNGPSASVIGAGVLLGVLLVAAAAGAAMLFSMYHPSGRP